MTWWATLQVKMCLKFSQSYSGALIKWVSGLRYGTWCSMRQRWSQYCLVTRMRGLCSWVWMDHVLDRFQNYSLFKHLGIILDEQLKFESRAEYSASKARRALNKLSFIQWQNRNLTKTWNQIIQMSGAPASGIFSISLGHYNWERNSITRKGTGWVLEMDLWH